MPQTLSERFRQWRSKCSRKLNPTVVITPAFFVLGGSIYLIGNYVHFRYKFILYIVLICMFITFCSCFQNIHSRIDKLCRKCFRKIRAQDDSVEAEDGSNTSRSRSTPLAWSEGQEDNSSRQPGAYTVDHVYHLPSLGQMEDPPPRYDDVIASEPLPPSYEEATKT